MHKKYKAVNIIRYGCEDTIKKSILNSLRSTIFSKILEDVKYKNLLEWADKINNKVRKSILEKGIFRNKELIRYLKNHRNLCWKDPIRFKIYVFRRVARIIDNNFESDDDYIEYLNRLNINNRSAELKKLYKQFTSYNSQDLNKFELNFSQMYFLYSKHYESIISNSWDNKPETGQYALYQDECTVLVKIIGKNLEPIRLNDITNEPVNSGENIKIYDDIVYKIVTVSFDRNCSMDSLVSSYLINEPNKTGYITNQMEPYIDLYDENPLPIEA